MDHPVVSFDVSGNQAASGPPAAFGGDKSSKFSPVKDRDTVAFVFDIDGVLLRGSQPLPGAQETLMMLKQKAIPFAFLTNGGGLTELEHAYKVSSRLKVGINEAQFVQSHTPFRSLVSEYADKTVLVVGGHSQQIRDVALNYGFKKVVTPGDILLEHEYIHPFPEMTATHHGVHGRRRNSASALRVALIAVFSSPRDWCLDLQIIVDLLLSSGGFLGTRSPSNGDSSIHNCGFQQDGQPLLYLCNPDFEWATGYEQPRFAQGAFLEALKGIWAHVTAGKGQLLYNMCGKPTEITFTYGEKVLQEYHEANFAQIGPAPRIRRVYMIGDNPESDICGANAYKSRYGSEWRSVLVESGVYVPGTTSAYTPFHVAKDVKEAVCWALEKEGGDFDMSNTA